MENQNRIEYLDIAKGFGIIFVLLFHSCGIPYIGGAISAFFMPLFFLISGYLCRGIKGKNIKILMANRAQKLLKPYFIYNIILGGLFLVKFCILKLDIKELYINALGIFYSRYVIKYDSAVLMGMSNNALWFLTAIGVL